MEIWLVLIFVVTMVSWLYLKNAYNYWKERRVPYIEPNLLFGNSVNMILGRVPTPIEHLNLHRQLSPYPYAGLFMLQRPELLIRDPELIKQILTKDFPIFRDRGLKFDYDIDPLARHLFGLNGPTWKRLRAKLTCTFTNAKMRSMFTLIEECAVELASSLDVAIAAGTENTIEIKDVITRYTTDVIGSCAFGLDLGAIKNPNSKFRSMAGKLATTGFRVMLRALMPWLPKFIVRLFKMHFIDPEASGFFINLVKSTVEYRETNRIVRNDFLDLLIKLRNEERAQIQEEKPGNDELTIIDMTIELMTAQCVLFFAAGSDTTGNVMSFFFYEIAKRPEIQEKLREEINELLLKAEDRKLSYELLKEMIYMDAVIKETMRMYPPATMISRQCAENYKLPNSDLVIPKGLQVSVSIIGVHYDERNYRDPEQFDPNRFLQQEPNKHHPYAFIPFGEGPRRCIAGRFAMMQMKTAITLLIRKYEFSLSEKTKLPLTFKHFGVLAAKDGIWLRFKKRVNM